jgi:hypothetical protein
MCPVFSTFSEGVNADRRPRKPIQPQRLPKLTDGLPSNVPLTTALVSRWSARIAFHGCVKLTSILALSKGFR